MKNNRWSVFGICAALFLMSMLFRSSAAVIAPDISRDLGLSPNELGLLGALFFYVFGAAQFPLGFFLDRVGSKRTMLFLNLLGVVGAVIFGLAKGPSGGFAGRALLGLGMSANLMGSLKLFTRWFGPEHFATISGLMLAVGSFGAVAASSPLVLLVRTAGWRGAFFCLAGLTLFLCGVFFLVVREAPGSGAREAARAAAVVTVADTARSLFRSVDFWAISLASGLRYGAFAAIQTLWAGPFLIIFLGLPALTAGNLLLMLNIGSIVGAPTGGYLSDSVLHSRKKTVTLSLAALSLIVLALSFWPGPQWLWGLGLLFFGLGFFASFSQVMYAHIKDLMPAGISGSAMTGINFFAFLGAGLFLQGLGGLVGKGGASLEGSGDYRSAFLACFVALLVGTASYCFSKDSKAR
ncbi:MAG: MFS transporter [Pseudomonadota bacterium]